MAHHLPTLRSDLRIIPPSEAGDGVYIIEDPLRNTFFRIGRREYRFLCRLGNRRWEGVEPKEDEGEEQEDERLSQEDEQMILRWLATKQLLQEQDVQDMQAAAAAGQNARRARRLRHLNLIVMRLPLFNPDRILCKMWPWFGWLTGPLFLAVWLLLGITALTVLLAQWPQFVQGTQGILSATNVLFLLLIFLLLKILHEFFHALACYRHGGRVYEMGVLLILFFPLTYVDGTSSWSFRSRWNRIHVAVAGIYIELFIAFAALLYWAMYPETLSGLLAHNTVLVAGVSSLLFNANPLMRFDGYYILSDLVNIPNLYFRGLGSVSQLLRRWLFGVQVQGDVLQEGPGVHLYGVAVYLWRIVVVVTLGLLASRMFSGWGLLLTIAAAISWIYQPTVNLLRRLPEYKQQNPKLLFHLCCRVLPVCLLAGFLLFGWEWQATIRMPAVVLFAEQESIRAGSSGFVQKIVTHQGDQVVAGQELAQLINEDLTVERNQLSLELAKLDLQERQRHAGGDHAGLQTLAKQREVVIDKLRALEEDLQHLHIVSPMTGTILTRDPERLVGTWVTKGEELMQVVAPEDKELVVAVPQKNISVFQEQHKREVHVTLHGGGDQFTGRIDRISPKATIDLPHYSLAAPYGGPLDVRASTSDNGQSAYQLFSPYFTLHVAVPTSHSKTLHAGQRAVVSLKGKGRRPGFFLYDTLKQWFVSNRMTTTQGLD